jgi:hypothetical protein
MPCDLFAILHVDVQASQVGRVLQLYLNPQGNRNRHKTPRKSIGIRSRRQTKLVVPVDGVLTASTPLLS